MNCAGYISTSLAKGNYIWADVINIGYQNAGSWELSAKGLTGLCLIHS